MRKYYLGGDASKGYTDFVIIDDMKKIIEPNFQIDDTYSGHQTLEEVLKRFFTQHPDAVVFAAMESTGGYENNWLKKLKDLSNHYPIQVARINPKGVNYDSKAALQKCANDKLSALNVAEYQINHPEKILYNQEDRFQSLRRMLTVILGKIKNKAALLNQLETLLYTANPEIMQYCKEKTPLWVLRLLSRFPSAASLASTTVEDLCSLPYISITKAKKIIDHAKHSVASVSDDFSAFSIAQLAENILYFQEQIKKDILFMENRLSHSQIHLLKTFNGIGTYSAMVLIIEIGDINRFPNVKKFVAFLGLHPVYKQSGDGKWAWHMSKQGRKKARAILYMIAFSALSNNPLIRHLYHSYRSRGMGHKFSMAVCMHKIARIIYAMLKYNRPFDLSFGQKSRQIPMVGKKPPRLDMNRRYHKEDAIAPISYRQTKKRKERQRSQSELVTICEIQLPAPSGV